MINPYQPPPSNDPVLTDLLARHCSATRTNTTVCIVDTRFDIAPGSLTGWGAVDFDGDNEWRGAPSSDSVAAQWKAELIVGANAALALTTGQHSAFIPSTDPQFASLLQPAVR
jgi:hypothetical protein